MEEIKPEPKPEPKSETKPEKKTRIRRKAESVPFLGTSLNSVLPPVEASLPVDSVPVASQPIEPTPAKKEIKMKSKKK
jgi:hypothetical protein